MQHALPYGHVPEPTHSARPSVAHELIPPGGERIAALQGQLGGELREERERSDG